MSQNNGNNNGARAYKKLDTRRTISTCDFKLPSFQYKKKEKHRSHNEPNLMFREYFPNRPDYTLEQNQTYRARINQRVVNTMKSMVENEGANNLKLLNANEMIDVSSNVERTNAYLQVLARKKLDIKQIANEELIKMNNELMGSHRTILHSMHMQQRQMELINAKEKKENRRFALMFRNKFEDRKRFQMASKSPEERRRQTKIQEYLDNMLKNHEDETFSSQLLNTKRQIKKYNEWKKNHNAKSSLHNIVEDDSDDDSEISDTYELHDHHHQNKDSDYYFWRKEMKRKKRQNLHRHRRHLHHLSKLSAEESITVRQIFHILKILPIKRLVFLRQLATRKHEAESILEKYHLLASLIQRREALLVEILDQGRKHQWLNPNFIILQDEFIDLTHQICEDVLSIYDLYKIYVEYGDQFYLIKMHNDDVILGASRGKEKMKLFSKVVIPLVNSMVHETRYGGLRL